MSIASALSDMKAEVLSGKSLDDAANIAAEDYSLNPVLLVRKFNESFGSVESVVAFAASTSPEKAMADKLESVIIEACKYHGVARANAKLTRKKNGKMYTVICRTNSRTFFEAVRHEDMQTVRLRIEQITWMEGFNEYCAKLNAK